MIVKMKRLSLLGLSSEKDKLLSALAHLCSVDVSDQTGLLGQNDWAALTSRDSPGERLFALQNEHSQIRDAIAALTPYDTRKKQLISVKKLVGAATLDNAFENRQSLLNRAAAIQKIQEEIHRIWTEENRLAALGESLSPYETLDIALSQMQTRFSRAIVGILPGETNFEEMQKTVSEAIPQCYFEMVSENKEHRHILIIYHVDMEHDLQKLIKKYGFSQVNFRGITGTPAEEKAVAIFQQKACREKRENLVEELRSMAQDLSGLELVYDGVSAEIEKEKIKQRLLKTQQTFYLSGYLPADAQCAFEKKMEPFCCAYEMLEPDAEEEVPVLLKNNAVVEPYEMVTELYSSPSYRGIDPDAVMAPFFCLFFGMMLSDAGYGILITALCSFVLWKFKPRGGMKKALMLGLQCGISTTVMGFVFGSFFGDLIPVIQGMITGTPGKVIALINPMEDPMTVLIISMLLGVIHLFAGIGLKMYVLIRDKDYLGAFADNGLWILVISGCGLLFLGGIAAAIGKYVVIFSAVGLVLTQGRDKKNIVMKFFSGVLSLYGITGYLSDILSYSRLLALGLATAVISSVINAMGSMGGASFGGFLVLAIAVLVGHSVNIAINVLGAFVHSSRLQYVEFFGKFYESGDKKFTPFQVNSKYVDIDLLKEEI